jgi:tetratricopeptide (TPR) repeat protein
MTDALAAKPRIGVALIALAAALTAATPALAAPPAPGRLSEGVSAAPSQAERAARYAGLSLADAIRQALIDDDLDFAMTSLGALGAATGDRNSAAYFRAIKAFSAGDPAAAERLLATGNNSDVLSAGLLAWSHVAAGDVEAAIKVWDAYGRGTAPAFHAAYRGLLAEAAGRADEALIHYARAGETGELHFARDVARRYAAALARAGKRKDALEAFDEVFGPPADLDRPDAAFRAALSTGRPPRDPVVARAALSSLVGNYAAGGILARALRDARDEAAPRRRPPDPDGFFINDALALRTALLVDPGNVDARLTLADVLETAEEPAAARTVLEPAKGGARAASVAIDLAYLYNGDDKPSRGLALIETVDAADRGLDWWLLRATLNANAARWDEALGDSRKATELAARLSPDHKRRADLSLASILLQRGEEERAVALVRPIVAALDRDKLLRGYAGLFLARVPATRAEGLIVAREGLEARGVDADYRASLGGILAQSADTREEGVQILRDALAENPRSPGMMNNLGYTLVDEDIDPIEGFNLLQKAYEAKPESSAIADSFGWAHYKLGEFEEARVLIEKAVALSADAPSAEIHDNLGDVYWRLNRPEDARAQWRRALAIGGHYPDRALLPEKIERGLTTPPPGRRALPVQVEPGSV